jgi:hypothetical protein
MHLEADCPDLRLQNATIANVTLLIQISQLLRKTDITMVVFL